MKFRVARRQGAYWVLDDKNKVCGGGTTKRESADKICRMLERDAKAGTLINETIKTKTFYCERCRWNLTVPRSLKKVPTCCPNCKGELAVSPKDSKDIQPNEGETDGIGSQT